MRGSVDCVTVVTEGLLLLLRDVMLVLPDSMVHQVLSHVIKVQALLVMANHHSPEVRSAVVKVLSASLSIHNSFLAALKTFRLDSMS